ncbi:MAG TPA: ABC transporter ATP-binding protein, partial [Burkholderiales bacterium]|nr:ABC transporter ATP-binding protein [Burkholderiales bacterium]
DLELEIACGEFFSLLGPSGCGKTTTLRMVGGFEEPTAGAIYLGGQDVTDLPPYRRDVNTVFQSYALFPHLNVFENIAFGLRRKKVPESQVESRVRDALRLVDLPSYERRKPSQLSGGQQQRVALARALVNHPKVLLLDEPMGALDAKLRKQMQLELKRIQKEVGITFLYVTHDQEEAMSMSDRIAVMRSGRIEDIGPPEQVYDNPATEFVAGFLGASNLLDGEVKERGGELATILAEGGSVVRVETSRMTGRGGGTIKVGVRPEKIRIEPAVAEPTPGCNSIVGTVATATYIGVSHQYKVDSASGKTLTVYAQNLGGEPTPRPGDRVRLTWRPEHTFVVAPSEPMAEREEEA